MTRFKFTPPEGHDDCPYKQVHYGFDFSGGKICEVTDPFVARKLRGTGYFTEVKQSKAFERAQRPFRDLGLSDSAKKDGGK